MVGLPKNTVNPAPLLGAVGFDKIYTAVCNHRDSYTVCMLCHLNLSTETTGHDDGWGFWSALSSGFIDGYSGLNGEIQKCHMPYGRLRLCRSASNIRTSISTK